MSKPPKGSNAAEYAAAIQRGADCYKNKDYAGAVEGFRQAAELDPTSITAWHDLGVTLIGLERFDEALEALNRVLKLDPQHASAHNNLGTICEHRADLEQAAQHYRRAIALDPAQPDAHFNLGMWLLRQGRFREGWRQCEWRWRTQGFTPFQCPQPRWDGEQINGTLLVHTEQGAGDVIQFARFLPMAAKRCKKLIVVGPANLQALVSKIEGVAEYRLPGDIPTKEFEAYCPIMSLPLVLGTRLDNIPAATPYLVQPPDDPRLPLGSGTGLKIGIVWAGSPTHRDDRHRSIPFTALSELIAARRDVRWYSLQREFRSDEPNHFAELGVTDIAPILGDYWNTAALISQLDLVISVDTYAAHLAAALNKPVWMLACKRCDWRWGPDDGKTLHGSIWYPTLRVLKQSTYDDWSGPVAQARVMLDDAVNHGLEKVMSAPAPLPPMSDEGGDVADSAFPANDADLASQPLLSVSTDSLPKLLEQFGISLLVSTYQAGRLIVVRNDGGALNTHFRSLPKPMGMATDGRRVAVGTSLEIKTYRNVPAACPRIEPKDKPHDACYVPADSRVTGDIDIHEMAFAADGELWFINTRFSCLCTIDGLNNFVPRWRPKFVTQLAPQDRCHLNGLAMRDGKPRYVTALGESDAAEGWRANKAKGGVLIDLNNQRVICHGLSMPHSPRWYNDQLWVLESGEGSLARVDTSTGKLTTVARLNGFTRGLSFHGPLAFIGLSKVREKVVFDGLPLTQRTTADERECGVWVVNILSGETVAFLRFTSGVKEIFAVNVVPHRFPEVLPPESELIQNTYVIPDEALTAVPDELRQA